MPASSFTVAIAVPMFKDLSTKLPNGRKIKEIQPLVFLLRAKKRENGEEERRGETGIEAISVRTMAQETLGDFGTLATVAYVFLGYTSMVAYVSKSGEILL
ncbi:hypothetical protein SDJN02_21394 [Cucurbita argyrosperma subsp. argyrosperma]|nr:hypothetical protein SDJN02_21394 [Cucurbita argyrosperma subsp. argyrosperma]